jgi:hypothetical protein
MTGPEPDPPPRAYCYRSYFADLLGQDAFMFRICETNTKFRIYAPADRYTVGGTYLLTLTPETRPTPGAGRSEGDT